MALDLREIKELSGIEDGIIIVKNGMFKLMEPLDYGEVIIKYQDKKTVLIKKAEMFQI